MISWKLTNHTGNNFVLLMYHRIIPGNEASKGIQDGIYVKPETFNVHIRFIQRHFTITHIAELLCDLKGNTLKSHAKPLCVLTFDDGWRDFYTHAFPLLKQLGIPATVFLPTDYIGTNRWFWTDRLTYLLFQRENLRNSVRGSRFSTDPLLNQLENLKGSQESQLEKAIQMLKAYREEEIEEILSELSINLDMDANPPVLSRINFFLLSRRFKHLVAVSRDIHNSFLNSYGFPEDKVMVIHNGINIPEECYDSGNRVFFVIGSSGRLFPVKDYPFMVQIARRE